jgi:hypothetical protein
MHDELSVGWVSRSDTSMIRSLILKIPCYFPCSQGKRVGSVGKGGRGDSIMAQRTSRLCPRRTTSPLSATAPADSVGKGG